MKSLVLLLAFISIFVFGCFLVGIICVGVLLILEQQDVVSPDLEGEDTVTHKQKKKPVPEQTVSSEYSFDRSLVSPVPNATPSSAADKYSSSSSSARVEPRDAPLQKSGNPRRRRRQNQVQPLVRCTTISPPRRQHQSVSNENRHPPPSTARVPTLSRNQRRKRNRAAAQVQESTLAPRQKRSVAASHHHHHHKKRQKMC